VLRARFLSGLALDEFIVDNADAVTREYHEDLAVARGFRNRLVISVPHWDRYSWST